MVLRVGREYFEYMAGAFPVMCSNDEFYYLPQIESSLLYLDRLDSFAPSAIKHALSRVQVLMKKLDKLKTQNNSLDTQIDCQLLHQSMATFLREFGKVKIWQKDPTIYIKIYLFGIDQLVSKLHLDRHVRLDSLESRVKQAKRLFKEAESNLKKIPKLYKETALKLIASAVNYLNGLPMELSKEAKKPLESFEVFLKKAPSAKSEFFNDRKLLEELLETNYSYTQRSLEEIFDIAEAEYKCTLEEMKGISKGVTSKNWQKYLSSYYVNVNTAPQLLRLYNNQIKRLKRFLIKKDIISIPKSRPIIVKNTPLYLIPIRQTASCASRVSQDNRDSSHFYVTIHLSPDKKHLLKQLSHIHNEYIFVSAHETFPGHHLLDSTRLSQVNPIRRSIESPLFYEGWASYAERLIDSLGYVQDPKQRLVGLKRQAWRAVRSMLDVGLRIGKLTMKGAGRELAKLGYHKKLVEPMVKHYAETYGYQLTYAVGKFEFERLRNRFAPEFGLKKFHDLALENGEASFELLEKKLEDSL